MQSTEVQKFSILKCSRQKNILKKKKGAGDRKMHKGSIQAFRAGKIMPLKWKFFDLSKEVRDSTVLLTDVLILKSIIQSSTQQMVSVLKTSKWTPDLIELQPLKQQTSRDHIIARRNKNQGTNWSLPKFLQTITWQTSEVLHKLLRNIRRLRRN